MCGCKPEHAEQSSNSYCTAGPPLSSWPGMVGQCGAVEASGLGLEFTCWPQQPMACDRAVPCAARAATPVLWCVGCSPAPLQVLNPLEILPLTWVFHQAYPCRPPLSGMHVAPLATALLGFHWPASETGWITTCCARQGGWEILAPTLTPEINALLRLPSRHLPKTILPPACSGPVAPSSSSPFHHVNKASPHHRHREKNPVFPNSAQGEAIRELDPS